MNRNRLSRQTGICVLITGIGHTLTHLIMNLIHEPDKELEALMINTKVSLITERSVLDYHHGFSLAMGILLIGLGVQILLSGYSNCKKELILHLSIVGLMAITSIIYFHPLAIAFMSTSFVSLLLIYVRYDS